MEEFLAHATQVNAFNYFGVLILVSLIQRVVPRRGPGDTLALRWFGNATMAVLGAIMVRSLFPILGLAWAVLRHERGWGLFNRIGLPSGARVRVDGTGARRISSTRSTGFCTESVSSGGSIERTIRTMMTTSPPACDFIRWK